MILSSSLHEEHGFNLPTPQIVRQKRKKKKKKSLITGVLNAILNKCGFHLRRVRKKEYCYIGHEI